MASPSTTRLERLNQATKDMPIDRWNRFESFFLGALSVEVSDEVWDSCLRTTTNFFAHNDTKESTHVGRQETA